MHISLSGFNCHCCLSAWLFDGDKILNPSSYVSSFIVLFASNSIPAVLSAIKGNEIQRNGIIYP